MPPAHNRQNKSTSAMFQENMRRISCFLLALSMMAVALPSNTTSKLPCVNCPTNRQCWGKYDINTDYYKITPDTGRTVEVFILRSPFHFFFDSSISWQWIMWLWLPMAFPVRCSCTIINSLVLSLKQIGEIQLLSMSPTISKIMGIPLPLTSRLELIRRTSIHWHGVLMEHNVANDGVPGITQCTPPIWMNSHLNPASDFPPKRNF